MRLLAGKAVELGFVPSVSHETVRKTLKNELRPHLVKQWVIPPKRNAAFVWQMEEVLNLYEEPYDPKRPTVCFDERPCQLLAKVREPQPIRPGKAKRFDSEYERRGTAHVLMAFEPLTGWRGARSEGAVAAGNLPRWCGAWRRKFTRKPRGSVWCATTFRPIHPRPSTRASPEQARRLARGIEFVYTPVRGSWLNMVEIELSVLVRQCLKRCIPDVEALRREVEAWGR